MRREYVDAVRYEMALTALATTSPASPILYGLMPFPMQFNASGLPAISLPLYWAEEELPIGVQFGGRHGDDATLIRLAGQLEQASPWFGRRPTIADSFV